MSKQKQVYIILGLSVLFTLVIQLELSRAIIFDDYLHTREIGGGAMTYYLSLINESSKGNWHLGSPYILEWRNQPYLYPALNINAAGFVKRLLGLDLKIYSLLMDYAAVFIIMSLVLSAFLILFRFNNFGYLTAIFYIFFPRTIGWNRILSPEVNFIPWALFLIFYFSDFKFWKREAGLAIFTGILFYIYPYYWTFALALLLASDLWKFWQQKKILWPYLYKYMAIGLLASWYAVHLWQISHLFYYKETMARIGALYSRWPAGLYTQIILLASIGLFFFFKKYVFLKIDFDAERLNLNKILPGLFASLAVLNQQIITGMQLEFNSHYLPVILIFLVSFWSIIAFYFINQPRVYKKIFWTGFAIIALGLIFNRAAAGISSPLTKSDYFARKETVVTDWFIKNHVQNKVVYAPEEINDNINFLTNNYLYFNNSQELLLMPTEEIIDRFIYFDLTNKNITENLLDQQVAIFGQTFKSRWQKDMILNKIKSLFKGKEFIPAPLNQYVAYDFNPIYKKRANPNPPEFIEYLDKYQVDYLVYRQKDQNSIYNDVPGKIVFEDDFYIIKERK